jgi:hypothetical protein
MGLYVLPRRPQAYHGQLWMLPPLMVLLPRCFPAASSGKRPYIRARGISGQKPVLEGHL